MATQIPPNPTSSPHKARRSPQHGSLHAYAHYKCRCNTCTTSWNTYYRNRRYQLKTTGALKTVLNRHLDTPTRSYHHPQ